MAKRTSVPKAAQPKRTAKAAAAKGRKTGTPPRHAGTGPGKTRAAGGAIGTRAQPSGKGGLPKDHGLEARATRKPARRARRLAPPPPPVVSSPFGPPPSQPRPSGSARAGTAPGPLADARGSVPREPATPAPGEGLPGYVDRGAPIPDDYKLDRLMAMARDPQWLFCYWELHGSKLPQLRAQRGQEFLEACAWVLRVYRINEGTAEDLEIEPAAGNWYVNVGAPGKYQLELALLSPAGEWVSLLVSDIIEMPREGLADAMDEEWRLSADEEERLLHEALSLAEARKRGISGFLGASRLRSSFGFVSSMMLGASASGRPVAGSWAWSSVGASGRVPGSGPEPRASASGPGAAIRHADPDGHGSEGGPNWNAQPDLPLGQPGKTQQPHFKVKLPRVLRGLPPPEPTRRVLSTEY